MSDRGTFDTGFGFGLPCSSVAVSGCRRRVGCHQFLPLGTSVTVID